MSKERNTEFRKIPGVAPKYRISRDGEFKVDGQISYSVGIVTALDGTRMTPQMCVYKAFPDIPMRYTPSW